MQAKDRGGTRGHSPVLGVGGQWVGLQKGFPKTPPSPGGDRGRGAISAGQQQVTGPARTVSPTTHVTPSPLLSQSIQAFPGMRLQPVTRRHPPHSSCDQQSRSAHRTRGRWGPGLLVRLCGLASPYVQRRCPRTR